MAPISIIILSLSILTIAILIFIHFRDQKLLGTITSRYRGTRSERKMVLNLLKRKIPCQTIFHDLYLRNSNGTYSQLDIVVATKVGIIVFEIKEYSGWIFGTGNQREWTQVLAYGDQKYRFYNPILQNKNHITNLIKQLPQFKKIPFYSVIVFFGNCEFRDLSLIPDDVYIIKSRQVDIVLEKILLENPQVQYDDKKEEVSLLNTSVQNGDNRQIREDHVRNIQTMLSR